MTPMQTTAGIGPCGSSHCTPLPEPSERFTSTGNQLTTKHARQLINGGSYAAAIGCPWTAHVTIHFRLAEGFTPETWAAIQTDLLDKASRWLDRHGVPVAFGWVRENGSIKGEHLHLFVHLPQPMWGAFKRYLLHAGRFTAYAAGSEAIRITGGRFGMYAETMRAGACRYALKSLSLSTCTALGIKHEPTLPVMVKRCGISASIGPKVREAAGWVELRSLPELHAHLHPARATSPVDDSPTEEMRDAA